MSDNVKAKILKDGVIVAGHPRSGTSLACQLVESAGVEFPSDFDGDEYNRSGYYELEASKKLSKKLIEQAMTVKNTIKMNKIVEKLNGCSGAGGLKVVRIPALFFYRHISERLRVVFVYRSPADVKSSLFRRGISSFQPSWFENNNALIAAYENIDESIIISFESLLRGEDWLCEAFAGIGLNVDLDLVKKKERTQRKSSLVLSPKEEKMYARLRKLEEDCREKRER
ncbi:MAG: hypothetical protein ACOCQC_01340 [Halanaerobiaceae bacterium]